MSKLTDEQITGIWIEYEGRELSWRRLLARAIEVAATEPLLQRIAELEEMNAQLREQNTEVDKACAELERQLEEARNHALEEAAKVCENMQQGWASDDQLKCAAAIRALKGANE